MAKFTLPNNISPFYKCKRIPRKMKKKYKTIFDKYTFLDVNEKLWYLLGYTNPEYKEFLINSLTND